MKRYLTQTWSRRMPDPRLKGLVGGSRKHCGSSRDQAERPKGPSPVRRPACGFMWPNLERVKMKTALGPKKPWMQHKKVWVYSSESLGATHSFQRGKEKNLTIFFLLEKASSICMQSGENRGPLGAIIALQTK